jgi:beta-galactosidase
MYRRKLLLILSAFIFSISLNADNRASVLVNDSWLYYQGDTKDGARVDLNCSDWQRIGLPHTMSLPYFEAKQFYMGFGWYRRHLNISYKDINRHITLEFDGVFQEAEIYVNGKFCGHHIGGYTGFSIDISNAVKVGNNLIAIRINNNWRPDVAARAGEHTFSGGIYRDVRLVITDRTYIDWCGTCITTPTLEQTAGSSSTVNVKTRIICHSDRPENLSIVQIVRDDKGKIIVKSSSEKTLQPQEIWTSDLTTSAVPSPRLWSPDTPYLYTLQTLLCSSGRVIDSTTSHFGFRWFRFTADHGFFLNGKHLYLRGANVHQDQAGWGDAATDSAAYRDVRMIKNCGMNFIRGSHYPHSPSFVKACDELGILFWSEAPYWSTYGDNRDGWWTASGYPITAVDTAAFEHSCLQQLREMIQIHRNSPSVIAWSMCNEPFFTDGRTLENVKSLLHKMVALSHQIDSTRPAGIGGCQRPTNRDRLDHIGDIAGYNGDGATISEFQNPGIPNIVTEYGSTMDVRPGKYSAGWGDLERNEAWKGVTWRSGQAIWCAFDHGTLASGDFGRMGFVDYQRLPKRRYYWYCHEYKGMMPPDERKEGVPAAVLLTASKKDKIKADGTDDAQLIVSVVDKNNHPLSNSPKVTLTIKSGPGQFPTGRSICFSPDDDIYIRDGQCAITIRSYYSGKTIVEASSDGLTSGRLTLSFCHGPRYKQNKTPLYSEHPYRRFIKEKIEETKIFGKNSPIFASSMEQEHTSSMSTDNDSLTYWSPLSTDVHPWLMLDTERCIILSNVSVKLSPLSLVKEYSVEYSVDGEKWATFVGKPSEARFVRIQAHQGIKISELIVHGK